MGYFGAPTASSSSPELSQSLPRIQPVRLDAEQKQLILSRIMGTDLKKHQVSLTTDFFLSPTGLALNIGSNVQTSNAPPSDFYSLQLMNPYYVVNGVAGFQGASSANPGQLILNIGAPSMPIGQIYLVNFTVDVLGITNKMPLFNVNVLGIGAQSIAPLSVGTAQVLSFKVELGSHNFSEATIQCPNTWIFTNCEITPVS